ncbi:general stress protein [Microbacterium sp. X-17]|uniref:general stress protein n=1 Tax=Microbacterium sp. X-17 TaxID=3144404 RepID=UPI0031F55C6D
MSMPRGAFPPGPSDVGHTVAAFPTYEAAQKAVSALIAGEIPAREIVIVGIGIRSVERVTGRLGYASAARAGAVNGVLLGLVLSAFFVLGSPNVQIQVFLGVMFVGIAIGMLFNLLLYVLLRRRRDFASVMQFVADRYEVNVSAGNVLRARDVLGPVAAAPARPAPPASAHEPPRYGERLPDRSARPAPPAEDAPPSGAPGSPDSGSDSPGSPDSAGSPGDEPDPRRGDSAP